MRETAILVSVLVLTGCEWNSNNPVADASVSPGDSKPRPDAAFDSQLTADAAVSMKHLLLSEVALQPGGSEFVEITNPTNTPIALANYYLADTGDYWKLPAGAPPLGTADFIAKFPDGAMLPAGGAITVALGTSASFTTAFGVAPTYSIADATITKVVVPGTPTLTDTGEIVVLFFWNGTAGLVEDVDIMMAGAPTTLNGIVSKSGAMLGSSRYATDANTIQLQSATPGSSKSTKRIAAEAGLEIQNGDSNGIFGDDETSEDTRMTWDSAFTAPTPNQAPTF